MCWRDDVPRQRICSGCGASYYGDLGHRNCPKHIKTLTSVERIEKPKPEELKVQF